MNFSTILNLLDITFTQHTNAQSEVIFYKLLGKSEKEIAEITGKTEYLLIGTLLSFGIALFLGITYIII